MIRAHKNINYQDLLILTVKEKYFSLFLGILISLTISSLTYRTFVRFLPTFKFKSRTVKNKVIVTKSSKTYVVTEGDDLWHISEKFYGSGFNAYDVAVANKIADSSNLEVGVKLVIPQVTPRPQTVGEISDVAATSNKYVVAPGDSLSIIAQKVYGDLFAWPKIMTANNLTTPDSIEVGMVLVIPSRD